MEKDYWIYSVSSSGYEFAYDDGEKQISDDLTIFRDDNENDEKYSTFELAFKGFIYNELNEFSIIDTIIEDGILKLESKVYYDSFGRVISKREYNRWIKENIPGIYIGKVTAKFMHYQISYATIDNYNNLGNR